MDPSGTPSEPAVSTPAPAPPAPGDGEAGWDDSPYRALLGAVSDAVFVHVLEGEGPGPYVEVNEVAVRRYGYSREELLRMRPADLIESGGLLDPAALAALRADGAARVMAVHRAKDGRRIPVVVSARLVNDNGRPVVTVVAREVPPIGEARASARAGDAPRRTAREALRASEEEFRLLVEGVRDYAIFMLDPDGYIVSWNAGAERIKGYRAEEVLGRHFSLFYPEAALATDHPAQELRIAAAEGRYEEEGWRVRKDGSVFWAHVVITALHGPEGLLRGFGKVTRDATERRRAEEALRRSEEQFRALFHDAAVGVALTGRDGRLTQVNAAFAALLGRPRAALVGRPLEVFTHPDDLPAVRALVADVLAGIRPSYQLEHRAVGPGGETLWLSVSASALRDAAGRPEAVIKTVQDVTERRRLEQAADEATEAERRRLSYELHDDLAQRLAGASVLAHTLARQLEGEKHEGAETAERVGALVRDAMAHARALSRALAPVDLLAEGLAEALGRLCASTEAAYGLPCLFHNPEHVRVADPAVATHLFRVAQEAVSNAARHAGATTIEVTLSQEPDDLRLVVHDDGHGIPAGALGGTPQGFGLRTMRARTAAVGGTLALQSLPDGGTTVTCTVPRRIDRPPVPPPSA